MPIASAMTAAHRDHPAVASVAQWPEIQSLVSRGQIVSADLLSRTDTQLKSEYSDIFGLFPHI